MWDDHATAWSLVKDVYVLPDVWTYTRRATRGGICPPEIFKILYSNFDICRNFTWKLYLFLEHQYQPVSSFLLIAAILVYPYLQLKHCLCTLHK